MPNVVSTCPLRDGPPLGFEVRRDHCTQAERRTVSARRAVASRRSVCLHQRQTIVRLACRGQRRRGPGHAGSTPARPQGGAQADAKTPEEAWRRSSHHRDRQARILPLGAARTWYCAAPRYRSLEEQPGREFPSAIATARTTDEALQVPRIGTALSLNPRRRLQCVQRSTPSDLAPNPALISRSGYADLAPRDSRSINRCGHAHWPANCN